MGTDPSDSGNTPFGESPHYVVAKNIDSKGNIVIEDPESPLSSTVYKTSSVLSKSNIKLVTNNMKNYKAGKGVSDENINNDRYFVSGSVIKKYLDSEGEMYDTSAAEEALKNLQDQEDNRNKNSSIVSIGSQITQNALSNINSNTSSSSSTTSNLNKNNSSSNTGNTSSISSTTTTVDGNNYTTNIVFNRNDESIIGNMDEILKQFKELNNTEDSSLKTLKEIYEIINDYEKKRKEASSYRRLLPKFALNNDGLEPILMGL